jgi:sirohydrochlorin ferrochelatase
MTHYLLIDHGSRNTFAHQQLIQITNNLKVEKDIQISYAHLEIAEPFFVDVLEKLCQEKKEKIIILPLFIFAGKHLSKDIPQIIEKARFKHPQIQINLENALGDSPLFTSSLSRIFNIT